MRWKVKPLICFWLSYVVFLSNSWKNHHFQLTGSGHRNVKGLPKGHPLQGDYKPVSVPWPYTTRPNLCATQSIYYCRYLTRQYQTPCWFQGTVPMSHVDTLHSTLCFQLITVNIAFSHVILSIH